MDVYERMFEGFKTFASRVETLSSYHIEGGEWEEFDQYRKGIPIEDFANQEWIEQISAWKKSGKEIKRIRVIPATLTEYLRYELEWCYPRNWIAGELIKVVGQKSYKQLVIPEMAGDFWLFDNKYVLKMKYDKVGRYLGEELISDQDPVTEYAKLITRLERRSVLFTKVLEKIRKAKLTILME
jgi:hypothetical protein